MPRPKKHRTAPYELQLLTRKRADGSTYAHYNLVYFDDQGTRHRVSLGTGNRQLAQEQASRLWLKSTVGANTTVVSIVEAYLDSLNGARDERRKRDGWKAAKPFWCNRGLDDINEETHQQYFKWRQRALNTVRNELSLVKSAFSWAATKVAGQLIAADQIPPLKVPGMPTSSVSHLSKDEFAAFLKGCAAPHVKLFAELKVATGARTKHLLQAQWSQVSFKRKQIDLNPVRNKVVPIGSLLESEESNKKRAIVPLNDDVIELLAEAQEAALTDYIIECAGQPIASIRKGFKAASERSGVHCTSGMLRHSAAVWMAEAGVSIFEIAQFLGHTDIKITYKVYARFMPDHLRNAAKALIWKADPEGDAIADGASG